MRVVVDLPGSGRRAAPSPPARGALVHDPAPTVPPLQRHLLGMQRSAGNGAVGALLAKRGPVLQRILDPGVTKAAVAAAQAFDSYVPPAKPDAKVTKEPNVDEAEFARRVTHQVARSKAGCKQLIAELDAYGKAAPALEASLDIAKKQLSSQPGDPAAAVALTEQILSLLDSITSIEEAGAVAPSLRSDWKNAGVSLIDAQVDKLFAVMDALQAEKNREQQHVSYDRVTLASTYKVEKTLEGLSAGTLTHMVVVPPTPTKRGDKVEGLSWQKDLFPRGTAVTQQAELPLPGTQQEAQQSATNPFKRAKTPGNAGPLEIMVVTGSHGGIDVLFEKPSGHGGYDAKYWQDAVITPLKSAGVLARYIVLDACVTANMIPQFAQLAAPGGKVLGTMVSLNGTLASDPEAWQDVLDALGNQVDVGKVLADQLTKSRGGGTLAGTSVYGVFDVDTQVLKTEDQLGPKLAQMASSPNWEEEYTGKEYQQDLREVDQSLRKKGVSGQKTKKVPYDELRIAVLPVAQVRQRLPAEARDVFEDAQIAKVIDTTAGDLDLAANLLFSEVAALVSAVIAGLPRGGDWIPPAELNTVLTKALSQAKGKPDVAAAAVTAAFRADVTKVRSDLASPQLEEARIATALRDNAGDVDMAVAILMSMGV